MIEPRIERLATSKVVKPGRPTIRTTGVSVGSDIGRPLKHRKGDERRHLTASLKLSATDRR
jgi:hypothetical protein